MAETDNIKVCARFRPISTYQNEGKDSICVRFKTKNSIDITVSNDCDIVHSFAFDHVFGPESRQHEVFSVVGQPVIEDVLNGYNGTIFVYGQTGSGKTYTMLGEGTPSGGGPLAGIIPRAVNALFSAVEKSDNTMEFDIKMSYVEIYMERIRDLLDPSKGSLALHEDIRAGKGVYVGDCTEPYVTTPENILSLVEYGDSNRSTATTRMNEHSSRSHAILGITVTSKDTVNLEQRTGKLFLVDLAGSEKVGRTKAEGQQLEEAKLINKSLSTLGLVILALTEKAGHIPYRDSKLTRLLQNSLGGNARTLLIVCCSCSSLNDSESLSTLRFGARAKTIKNKAVVNREYTTEELKLLVSKLQGELEQYRAGRTPSSPAIVNSAAPVKNVAHLEAQLEQQRVKFDNELQSLLEQVDQLKTGRSKLLHLVGLQNDQIASLREEIDMWEDEYAAESAAHELTRRQHSEERSLSDIQGKFLQKATGVMDQVGGNLASLREQSRELARVIELNLAARRHRSVSQDGAGAGDTAPHPTSGSSLDLYAMEDEFEEHEATSSRIAFLERQLSNQEAMWRELYDESGTIRLELELAKNKLDIRNERIENLKSGLREEKRHRSKLIESHTLERHKLSEENLALKNEVERWKRQYEVLKSTAPANTRIIRHLQGGKRNSSALGGSPEGSSVNFSFGSNEA